MRHNGKRYRHLLYEYEEIEEVPKKTPVKRQCVEKVKRAKSRKKDKGKKKVVTSAKKVKKAEKAKEFVEKDVDFSGCEEAENLNNDLDCHLSFQDSNEEIFAADFQSSESEEMKAEILPYTDNPEDDLGLTVRGVKLRPEVVIESLNVEGIKLPLQMTGNTPMADNAFSDFPSLSPMNLLSPFGFFEPNLNFPKTTNDLTEITNNASEKA